MRVRVRLFASLREAAGCEAIDLDLPAGATVADAWPALLRQSSSLEPWRGRALIALNRRYVGPAAPLADGDELALFPPVSGG
jgi:molybdopterin converting factor subunit 1